MSGKLFVLVWMTVWPMAALIPHLASVDATPPTASPPLTPSISPPPRAEPAPPLVEEAVPSEELPPQTEPQIPESAPKIRVPEATPDFGQSEKTPPRTDTAAFDKRPTPTRTGPSGPQSKSNSTPNVSRRPISPIAAREEAAQKLIHERAILRAQQRRSRLEAKQGRRPAGKPVSNWHPESSDPEWKMKDEG